MHVCKRTLCVMFVHALTAVPRVLMHIVNSLSPIVDVLLLYILTIALFSLIGQCTHTTHTHTHTAFNDMHVYVAHTPLHQYHTYEHTCMSSKCSQMNALYTLKRFHVNTFSFTGFYLYGTGNNIVSDHLKALSFESLTSILGKEPFVQMVPTSRHSISYCLQLFNVCEPRQCLQ